MAIPNFADAYTTGKSNCSSVASKILVMNNGDIIETGTHNELMKKGGFYEKLYNSQFEDIEIA